MQTISDLFKSTIYGLHDIGAIIKAAWALWAKLFSAMPYGDPWIAAVALAIVLVVVDRVLRPRNQLYG